MDLFAEYVHATVSLFAGHELTQVESADDAAAADAAIAKHGYHRTSPWSFRDGGVLRADIAVRAAHGLPAADL